MYVRIKRIKGAIQYYDFAANEMVVLNCGHSFRVRVIHHGNRSRFEMAMSMAVNVFLDITTYRKALPDIGVFTNG